ncbi:hypothetical protein Tco_0011678 [Tanacetum coccineum]
MLMEHRDDQGVSVFTSRAWRRMFDIRGPLVHELILEFYSTFRFGQAILDLDTLGTLQFQLGGARRRMSWREFILALGLHTDEEMQTVGFALWYTMIQDPILRSCHTLIACSITGRSQAPKKVTVKDLFYLRGMDVDSVTVPYLLARYLRLFAAGRKIRVIAPELPIIDMAEPVRLQIYAQFDDTWAWVAIGPERQPVAVAGAPTDAEDVLIVDEGGQANPTPVQAPQQPPPPPLAATRTIPQRSGRLEKDMQGLRRDVGSLHRVVERSITDQGRFSMWMMTCMTQLMVASRLTYQAFDGT